MESRRFLIALAACASLALGGRTNAQDSLNIVVVSPRVGAVIDAGERDYYRLFTQVQRFGWAVVLKGDDPDYMVYIMDFPRDGDRSDTILHYNKNQVVRIAQKIDYFEWIQNNSVVPEETRDSLPIIQGLRVANDQSLPSRMRAIVTSPPTVSGTPALRTPVRGIGDGTGWAVKMLSGKTLVNSRPLMVTADSLWVDTWGNIQAFALDSIQELRKSRPSSVGTGIVIGALTGGAVGACIGAAAYQEPKHESNTFQLDFGPGIAIAGGAVLGTLAGGVVGGIIAGVSREQFLDLSGRTPEEREQLVRQFIKTR